jgi:hypothetical protein
VQLEASIPKDKVKGIDAGKIGFCALDGNSTIQLSNGTLVNDNILTNVILDTSGTYLLLPYVDIAPPTADAGHTQTVEVSTLVTFDGSKSSDNVGIVSYTWDFGDGATGTGVAPTHTYTNLGNYTVILTVQDAAGNSASSTVTITVSYVIPESPSFILLSLLILTALIALGFPKKKKLRPLKDKKGILNSCLNKCTFGTHLTALC